MTKNKQCGIYCYHNIINGKNYVGQSVDLKRRKSFFSDKRKYSGMAFFNAVKKYGKENFQYSILTHCKPEELNYYEIFYIKRLKSNNQKYGYNLTSGGNSRYELSEETKEQIRNSWTDERKKEQSIKQQGCKNYNYGNKWNDEQKRHGSFVAKERANKKFLEVNGFDISCLRTKIKEYFFSTKTPRIGDIVDTFHISYKTAINACKEIKLNVGGIISSVYDEILKNVSKSTKKTVIQCDRANNSIILNVFESLSEAERITGIHSIKHCVEGKQYSAGGYFWKYSEDSIFTGKYNEEYLRPTNDRLKLTENIKQKLKDSGLYKRENLYKKVFCYDKTGVLKKIYDSVSSVVNDGFSKVMVSCCCNPNQAQRTHKNHVFSYKELSKEEVLKMFNKYVKKAIVQLTIFGDFIKLWESATDAGKELGINLCNINACCHGKIKTCGGYKWMFENEYLKISQQ